MSKVNERFPCKITITLMPEEQEKFDQVINEYDENENATGSAGLGLVQVKRMVSSSVYGYSNLREDLVQGIDKFADKPDAKVDALLMEVLRPSQSNHQCEIKKVIVFAVFVDTLRYLKIRLSQKGIKCAIIDGGVSDRQEVIDRFKADDDIRVLLSSEVGSEGLDMQFCDTIVNYDLPWNPMVVEQRIGRIDRIGQTAEKIYIYNFVVSGSITEDIYNRLETRIGIFQGTIGDLEPILSAPYKDGLSILEAHNNLETRYYRGEISKEQALREEELINQAIESQRMTIEELSSEMNKNTISMDSYYDEQINFIQKRKSYVTDVELRNLLRKVLGVEDTGCSQCVLEKYSDDTKIWMLKIPQNLEDRACLEKFLRHNRPCSSDSLKAYDEFIASIHGKVELMLTFDQTTANENHRMIFVNNYSPLILACNEFRRKSGMGVKKIFKFELHPGKEFDGVLKVGDKFLLLNYQLVTSGVLRGNPGSIKELYPILFDIAREEIVSNEEVISSVCSLSQDQGRETQMPSADECSHELVSKFKALATRAVSNMVRDKKKDIDEQNDVERERWIKEYGEFYNGKIAYYQGEIERCERDLQVISDVYGLGNGYGAGRISKIKNEMSGYNGTITRLKREKDEKLSALGGKSNVSISREEISACYIVIR